MKQKYSFALLIFLPTWIHAQALGLNQYSDISSITQIASNQKIQTELQKLLKHDYQKFQSHFEHYSAPYLLKTDEALYYEGRSGSSLDASSAIVFKDGRLFAAIYYSTTKTLKYFSSVHDKFHRTLILSGFCLLKIAKISLNSSFFPKPIKR